MKHHLNKRLELHAVDPRRRRLWWLGQILLVPVTVVVSALFTQHWLIQDYRSKLAALQQSRVRSMQQAGQITRLQHQLAIAQRAAQIDAAAGHELKSRLQQLEQRVDDANSQLAFYRELTKSGAQRKGLNVYDFSLKSTLSHGVYRYRITLAQNIERAQAVSGTVDLLVEGHLGKEFTRLNYAALVPPGQDNLIYKFKYFEQISGEIRIPEAFTPERVVLHIVPKARHGARINHSYDWKQILDAG